MATFWGEMSDFWGSFKRLFGEFQTTFRGFTGDILGSRCFAVENCLWKTFFCFFAFLSAWILWIEDIKSWKKVISLFISDILGSIADLSLSDSPFYIFLLRDILGSNAQSSVMSDILGSHLSLFSQTAGFLSGSIPVFRLIAVGVPDRKV